MVIGARSRPVLTKSSVNSSTPWFLCESQATAPTVQGEAGTSGLPVTFVDRLPVEAQGTLDAIAAGAPHPYAQDGSTFFNREGLLPPAAEGYYREFTVETPGSPDRGARRLVAGAEGEVFYTADHYGSFVEVVDADV